MLKDKVKWRLVEEAGIEVSSASALARRCMAGSTVNNHLSGHQCSTELSSLTSKAMDSRMEVTLGGI